MTVKRAIIHLNDADLSIYGEEGLLASSPGYAVVEPTVLTIGGEAYARARTNPRQTVHQFWSRLSQEPLPILGPRARTFADLAYAHLMALFESIPEASRPEEVLFSIPATLDRDQLALLLGIAGQCPFAAVGLVNAGVAGASVTPRTSLGVHLDGGLQHLVASAVRDEGGLATLAAHRAVSELGDVSVADLLVNVIRDEMIRTTRFDPLHNAATEQQIYDRITEWVRTEDRSIEVEAEHAGKIHRVSISRADVAQALQPRYDALGEALTRLAGEQGSVVVFQGDAATRLPGLTEFLSGHAAVAAQGVTSDADAASHLLSQWDQIVGEGDGVRLTTAVAWSDAPLHTPSIQTPESSLPPAPPPLPASSPGAPATSMPAGASVMVIHQNEAFGVTDRILRIGTGKATDGGRWLSIGDSDEPVQYATLMRSGTQILLLMEAGIGTQAQFAVGESALDTDAGLAPLKPGDTLTITLNNTRTHDGSEPDPGAAQLRLVSVADHGT